MKDSWIRAARFLTAPLRKLIVFIIGGTVLLYGIAAIVLPGPATLIIPAGLAILAIEFVWARRLLKRATAMMHSTAERLGIRNLFRRSPPATPPSAPDNGPCNGAPSAPRDDQTRTPGV